MRANEFAKATLGMLVVVEFDVIDPGNAPRWLLGYQAVGLLTHEPLHRQSGLCAEALARPRTPAPPVPDHSG